MVVFLSKVDQQRVYDETFVMVERVVEEGGGGGGFRGGRLQKFKRHPAAALTPFNSAKRRIGIESKLLFFDKKKQ